MRNHRFVYIIVIAAVLIIIGDTMFGRILAAKTSGGWYKLAKGNLEAEEVDGKWTLHPVEATYINMLGMSGSIHTILDAGVYEIRDIDNISKFKRISSSIINVGVEDRLLVKTIKAGGKAYGASGHTERLSDGRLVITDSQSQGNIYLIDSNGQVSKLLDNSVFPEIKKGVTGKIMKAANPDTAGDGETIIFLSNAIGAKDTIPSVSAYRVDASTGIPKLIIDGAKFGGDLEYISVGGNTVVAFRQPLNVLAVYDMLSDKIKEIPFSGRPVSISPDGKHLLFRNVVEGILEREFSILDIESGEQKKIEMPGGYYYSGGGVWSPSGEKLSFYLNGFADNDASKAYKTNVKIGVLNIKTGEISSYDKPSKSNLYVYGSMSWIEEKYITAYTDDNISWALRVEDNAQED